MTRARQIIFDDSRTHRSKWALSTDRFPACGVSVRYRCPDAMLPLAYVTTGQRVPNAILRTDSRQLVDLATGPRRQETWNEIIQATHARRPAQLSQHTEADRRLDY